MSVYLKPKLIKGDGNEDAVKTGADGLELRRLIDDTGASTAYD